MESDYYENHYGLHFHPKIILCFEEEAVCKDDDDDDDDDGSTWKVLHRIDRSIIKRAVLRANIGGWKHASPVDPTAVLA